jgi:hypothetical protein
MKNEDILNLIYSPPWVAKLLHLFISGAQQQTAVGVKTELIYLVLPLLATDTIRTRLINARSSSSFHSIFENNMADKKEYSVNLSERIHSFSGITNNGLIYLGNDVELQIEEYITISKPVKPTQYKTPKDYDYIKASFYLGLIFAKEDYRNVFWKLGVIVR